MKEHYLNTNNIATWKTKVNVGDKIYLSGTVYTARDAAHKRIFELLESKKPLPFPIENSVIYYCGPTPTPEGFAIGSCGPTTSARMDSFAPTLYDMSLGATIGKGERNDAVCEAIIRNNALYLCAIGGAGALYAKSITSCEVIAFDDLGCESVKRLEFSNLPLIVAIDSEGNNIFKIKKAM
ncbi:MAG: FumA C-terminus/TtdB family hydratase beta subunit [Acutalibacteraceae bacterium]|nr:FumA C-terminus/TtdB family hydratase beta subunit [Acutalibacteraceae bacterium]